MRSAVFFTVFLSVPAFADPNTSAGEALFQTKACTACHHPTTDQTPYGMGPSLQMIASAYSQAGGQEAIVRFLSAAPGSQPIVKPELYPVMKAQQALTKNFTDEERQALATYILRHTP